jgi:protein-S-isoprenylcysteine O-methyltransferase Ste14
MEPQAAASSLAARTLTILAAGFLAFDGLGLLAGGLWLGRPVLAIIGGCLIGSSGLVFVYWRWHQRQSGEIAAARRAVADEARALRDLVRRN